MGRRAALLIGAVAVALCASSAVALAAVLIGTDNSETINGSNSADLINGKGGTDTTTGRGGNDTYYYADGHGDDTVIEPRTVRISGSTRSGGIDSLDFSAVSGQVNVQSIPEWRIAHGSTLDGCRPHNQALSDTSGGGSNGRISLCYGAAVSASYVETITGGPGADFVATGGQTNTLKPGGGNGDSLIDQGGDPGDSTHPPLAASSDTFKGFTATTGLDSVQDLGGTADKLDLRPFESSDVYVNRSGNNLLVTLSPTSGVTVFDHFTPSGLIEQIIFADGTFGGSSTVASTANASTTSEGEGASPSSTTDTVEQLISDSEERAATSSEGAQLRKTAKKLAAEAEKAKKKLEAKLAEHHDANEGTEEETKTKSGE